MNNSFIASKCRIVSNVVQLYRTLPSIIVAFGLFSSPFVMANEDYNRDLEEQAYDFISGLAADEVEANEKTDIEMGHITEGTQYPVCEGELEFTIASGKVRRNNSIKITCHSKTTPYYLYITAKVTFSAPFVTVINAVPKGSILTADNLTVDYMNKVLDRGTAFTDPALLDGVHAKRDLKPGTPISKNQICVVCRGDEVFIEAGNSALTVKTKGESLQDGSFNDKIRVKNLKSGKVVRGEVIDSETVRIETR